MKNSKILAVLISVLFMTACSKDQKNDAQGGIEGGGGGTLITNAVGKYRIHQIVEDHKTDLRLVLKSLSNSPVGETGKKLFGGPKTIIDVLNEVDVEVLDERPCLDSAGSEVDGSIHASRPNMICISAFTIAPKVIEERVKTEVLALLIHELSHFLGTTEKEARDFQKWAASMLSRVAEEDADKFLKALVSSNEMLSRELGSMIENLDIATGDELYNQAFRVMGLHSEIETFTAKSLNVHDPLEEELFDAYWTILWSAMNYSRSLGSNEFAAEAKKDYEKLFGSNDELSLAQYRRAVNLPENIFGEKIFIPKIDSRIEMKQELVRLQDYFESQQRTAEKIIYGMPVPKFVEPGRVVVNPWRAYVGEYEVTENLCTGPSPTTGLIIEDRAGRLLMIRRWANGSMVHPLENGESDIGGTVEVGDGREAWRSVERGNLWGDSHQKFVEKLVQTNDGFELKSQSSSKSNTSGEPIYSESTCTLPLKKIN